MALRIGKPGLAIALALAALGCLAWGRSYALRYRGLDFYQFWAVGQASVLLRIEDPYTSEARGGIGPALIRAQPPAHDSSQLLLAAGRRKELQTYSTPFLYSCFGVFSSGDYDRDHRRFVLASVLAGALAIAALARALRYAWWAVALAIALASFPFAPYLSDLRVGNVTQIQLALVAAALHALVRAPIRWRALVAGTILGLGVAFKPNLAWAVLVLLFVGLANRRYRKVLEEASGIGLGIVAAVLFAGARFHSLPVWGSWARSLRELPDEIIPVERGNFSLPRLVSEAAGHDLGIPLAVLVVALVLGCAWMGRRRRGEEDRDGGEPMEGFTAISAGCLVSLIAVRLVWVHYFLLALPALLLALRAESPSRIVTVRRTAAAGSFLLIAGRPAELLIGAGHPWTIGTLAALGTLVLLVVTAGELLFLRGARPRP